MHVELHTVTHLHLCFQQNIQEVVHLWGVVLLTDKIKARHEISQRISLNKSIDLALNLFSAYNLETNYNNSDLEERELTLKHGLYFMEDSKLIFETDWFLVIIENITENVTKLDYCYQLVDGFLANFQQDLLEELIVVV